MSANRTDPGSEYYYLGQSRPVNLWRVLVDIVLVLLTVGLAAGLAMAVLATGISPERHWIFAFFGLVAPFLYLGNIVMLLVWVVRWRWWAVVPGVALLVGIGQLGTLVQFDIRKAYPTGEDASPATRKKDPAHLTLMTYNVHGFSRGQSEHGGYLRQVDSVAAYVKRMQPDVICFQEYETMQSGDVRRIDSLYRGWPYRSYNFIYGGDGDIGYGTAIFSRVPILKARRLQFDESTNSMLRADLLLGAGDTVRLFNNHLQSTQVDELSQERVERLGARAGRGDGEPGAEQFVRRLGGRLRDNYRRRAVQVDTVSRMVAASPYPVLVAGDFNDTPVSYTYRTMRGDLDDTFVNAGSGFAYTYNRLFSMLRIDYVFHSPVFATELYRSDNLPWSDHNPVVVRLRRTGEGTGSR